MFQSPFCKNKKILIRTKARTRNNNRIMCKQKVSKPTKKNTFTYRLLATKTNSQYSSIHSYNFFFIVSSKNASHLLYIFETKKKSTRLNDLFFFESIFVSVIQQDSWSKQKKRLLFLEFIFFCFRFNKSDNRTVTV